MVGAWVGPVFMGAGSNLYTHPPTPPTPSTIHIMDGLNEIHRFNPVFTHKFLLLFIQFNMKCRWTGPWINYEIQIVSSQGISPQCLPCVGLSTASCGGLELSEYVNIKAFLNPEDLGVLMQENFDVLESGAWNAPHACRWWWNFFSVHGILPYMEVLNSQGLHLEAEGLYRFRARPADSDLRWAGSLYPHGPQGWRVLPCPGRGVPQAGTKPHGWFQELSRGWCRWWLECRFRMVRVSSSWIGSQVLLFLCPCGLCIWVVWWVLEFCLSMRPGTSSLRMNSWMLTGYFIVSM